MITAVSRSIKGRGWLIVLICLLGQNCGMGLAYGSIGPLLASTEAQFEISRGLASAGPSMIALSIGLIGPFLGGLLARLPARTTMIAGALMSAVGYGSLAQISHFIWAFPLYALIGIGLFLTGIAGPAALIGRWFTYNRSMMFGVVNLPIAMLVFPYFVAHLLPDHGRGFILMIIAAVFLALVPVLFLIVESRPKPDHARPDAEVGPIAAGRDSIMTLGQIVRVPAFWLISLAIGIEAGSGAAFVIHIVPYGLEQHLAFSTAAGLLSTFAIAGLAGTLLFGWIADRIGPVMTLLLVAIAQASLWSFVVVASGPALFIVAALMGTCASPVIGLHGAALSNLFGPINIGRSLTFSYFVKLPFNFGLPPIVGYLFTLQNRYDSAFLITAGLCAAAALCFFVAMRLNRLAGMADVPEAAGTSA